MTQLDQLKLRLDIQICDRSKDKKLELILEEVKSNILAYTNRSELLPDMNSLQIKIAIIEYNKQASEGMSNQSQGGISQSFFDGLPSDVQMYLISFRRLKVSNYASKKS